MMSQDLSFILQLSFQQLNVVTLVLYYLNPYSNNKSVLYDIAVKVVKYLIDYLL